MNIGNRLADLGSLAEVKTIKLWVYRIEDSGKVAQRLPKPDLCFALAACRAHQTRSCTIPPL